MHKSLFDTKLISDYLFGVTTDFLIFSFEMLYVLLNPLSLNAGLNSVCEKSDSLNYGSGDFYISLGLIKPLILSV